MALLSLDVYHEGSKHMGYVPFSGVAASAGRTKVSVTAWLKSAESPVSLAHG